MPNILLVEDEPNNARLARRLLTRAGFKVQVAEEGMTGFTLAMADPPDLLLIDLGLPDLDGQTVVALLHQQQTTRYPIVAFTAWPEAQARDMAAAYGCDGVLLKPINTRTFAAQVRAFLPPAPHKPERFIPIVPDIPSEP